MSATSASDRLRLARLVVADALRRSRVRLTTGLTPLAPARAWTPEQLVIAPQDIRTSDPTLADDIYGGHFVFAGRIVGTQGESPFKVVPPSVAWLQALVGFGWLRHLRAADTALARANARSLVGDWIALAGAPTGPAWEPAVVARRLMSWLSQSPMILDGAEWQFYRRFMRSIGQHATFLERSLRAGLEGEPRLAAAIALAAVGVCSEGTGRVQRRSTGLLQAELGRQILADGGHASRNPRAIVDLLLDLLPLRQAYGARGIQAPPELLNAIDRMMPMLRLFRHADGALALFNGMGVTAPDALAVLLAYDDAQAAPLTNAPYSGYQRLEAGGAIVIVDSGRPPEREFAAGAHAGCLAFELSAGSQRIVLNCGAPAPGRADLIEVARATAAHSALVIEETSSCRFAADARLRAWTGVRILSGPENVTCERSEDRATQMLHLSHDGYAKPFGVIHERWLRLAQDGQRLDGDDIIATVGGQAAPTPALAYALRFHLHPSLRVHPALDRQTAEIDLPNGEVWRFSAGGLLIEIEDSIFLAAPNGAQRTSQIVLHADTDIAAHISWSFERLSDAPAIGAPVSESPG